LRILNPHRFTGEAAGSHTVGYPTWFVGKEVLHAIGRFQRRLSADPAELSGVATRFWLRLP